MRKNIRADEVFPIKSREDESKIRRSYTHIECSGCDNEASFVNATHGGKMGVEIITRRFTRLGWYVGQVVGSHLCPTCNPKRQERTILTLVPTKKVEEEEECAVAQREMTFADRRIINAKLEEVYENDLVGYRDGWTDVRVASDLGTDTSWVEQLRAANFGPAEGNAEVATLKRELAEMGKQLDAFQSEGVRLVEAYKQLAERLGKIAG